MVVLVDFIIVLVQGLEIFEYFEVLVGLCVNEVWYFYNKFKYMFEVLFVSEEFYVFVWVIQILVEECDIIIVFLVLEISINDVEGIYWVYVFYVLGLVINVLWMVVNFGKWVVGFKLCDGMD